MLQGPSYILARYETVIFSKCSHNFQNIFFKNQGCGSKECILFNGLLNLTPLSVTLASNFMSMKKRFAEDK